MINPFEDIILRLERIEKLLQEQKNNQVAAFQERFLSPAETVKMFEPNISISTLSNWEKQGLVNKHFIGGRTFYKYSEIIESVKHLQRYKCGEPLQLPPRL